MDLAQIVKRYRNGYSLNRDETDALIALAEEALKKSAEPRKAERYKAVKE